MKKTTTLSILAALCVTLCACQDVPAPESPVPDETNTTYVAETDSSASTETSPPSTEPPYFITSSAVLPADFPENNATAEPFLYSDYVEDGSDDYLSLVALDKDFVYLQKSICNYDNTSDLIYYKYNRQTGGTIKLDGNVSNYNSSVGTWAFADGKLQTVMETIGDGRIHYAVDTENNSVEILRQAEFDPSEESFYWSYRVNDTQYAELWFDMGSKQTYHIALLEPDGTSREIFTKEFITTQESCRYYVRNDRIYEYVLTSGESEAYMNIYDLDANLLSSSHLPQVQEEVGFTEASYVTEVNAFGQYYMITVENSPFTKAFLYHETDGFVMALDGCSYVAPVIPSETGKHLLQVTVMLPDGSDKLNLYSLDDSGEITPIAEGLDRFAQIVTDGSTIAYFEEDVLYTMELT